MMDHDEVQDALLNAVIFDQRDNVDRVPGRAMETSHTLRKAVKTGLKAEAILAEIKDAVENQGRFPEHHRKVMRRHRLEWPTLWNAIDKIWGPEFYGDPGPDGVPGPDGIEIPLGPETRAELEKLGVEGMSEPPGQ